MINRERFRLCAEIRCCSIFGPSKPNGVKRTALLSISHHAVWATQGSSATFRKSRRRPRRSDRLETLRALVRDQHLSFPILRGSDDVAAIYNILYRYLFDRHRDLSLPTSFLINASGEIVKIYQGPVNAEHVDYDFSHIPEHGCRALIESASLPRRDRHRRIWTQLSFVWLGVFSARIHGAGGRVVSDRTAGRSAECRGSSMGSEAFI